MDQDDTGTPNPIAPAGASNTNKATNETITVAETETTTETITTTPPTAPPATQSSISQPKKPKGLIAAAIILAILALASIAFGIYELMDADQKSSQISSLENEISEKETKIAELEITISELEAKLSAAPETDESTKPTEDTAPTTEDATEPTANQTTETTASNEAPTIELISEITETDTTKVYKIGECTADSGTSASSHFSLKCHVTISGKDALISYHDGDNNILRLSLPKN